MIGRDHWTRASPGLGACDERRLPTQASRGGFGTARTRPAPAAKRRRLVLVQVVLSGLGGGGRRLGASRRCARASAVVGRAGRALGRARLPRRARRALLRLSPRPP